MNTYRDANRRKHKLLGVYLSLLAWKKGVDCVILQRDQLLPFLDLDKMQKRRIDWVKNDISYLFPYAWNTYNLDTNSYATLYLSRFPITEAMKIGTMTDEKLVELFASSGLKAAIFKIPKEPEIIRILATVTHGIADFTSL